MPAADMPRLRQNLERVDALIATQLKEGEHLLCQGVQGSKVFYGFDFDDWRDNVSNWRRYTADLLKMAITTTGPADEFGAAYPMVVGGGVSQDVDQLRRRLNTLKSIRQRLPLYDTALDGENVPDDSSSRTPQVFVVHGHDEALREQVVRQLETAGPHPVVVLHEQPNRGVSILEKLEANAAENDFAVVLLTGDDLGRATSTGSDEHRRRARQNVVFELGFFVGRLGRHRVAAIYEEGVELPSDYGGVAWISRMNWRAGLLDELNAAEFSYDLNLLIRG